MSEVSRSDQHPLQDRCSPPSLTSSCLIIFASGMREEVEKHVSGAPSVTPSLLALLANHICRTTLFRSLLAASPLRRWGRRWWSQRERWGEIKEGNFERARGSKDEKLKILVEDSRGYLWGKQRSAVGRPRSTHMQTLSELSNIYPASEKNMWTAGYCTHILDVGQRPSMSKFVTFRKWKPLFLRDCVNIMTWWHQSLFWRKGQDFICHSNSKICSLHLIQPLLISSLQPVWVNNTHWNAVRMTSATDS